MNRAKPSAFTKAIITREATSLGLAEDDWEILSKDRKMSEIKIKRGTKGHLVRGFVWRLGLRYHVGSSAGYFDLNDRVVRDFLLIVFKSKKPALLK